MTVSTSAHNPDLYRFIVENAIDFAIFTVDRQGLISSWNCGAERIFQYKDQDIIGRSIAVIFIEEDRKENMHVREMSTALAEGRAADMRWHLRKDGTLFWASGSIMPLFDDKKEHIGYFKIVQDKTDAKQAEEKIAQLNEELEQKVRQRTVQLQQQTEQLRRLTHQLIETEEREKRQLAEILHDEHQQLLVAIRLQMRRLKFEEGTAQDLTLKSIQQLLEQVIHKNRALTKELWNPALVNHGFMPGLEWLRKYMQAQYHLNIHLNTSGPLDKVSFQDIKILLYQSIRELLMNIVKHASVNEAYLDIHAESSSLVIKVRDTGKGFDPAKIDAEGLDSFGLFSIRERLQILNGTMHLTAEPGKGTSVEFTVPVTYEDV